MTQNAYDALFEEIVLERNELRLKVHEAQKRFAATARELVDTIATVNDQRATITQMLAALRAAETSLAYAIATLDAPQPSTIRGTLAAVRAAIAACARKPAGEPPASDGLTHTAAASGHSAASAGATASILKGEA